MAKIDGVDRVQTNRLAKKADVASHVAKSTLRGRDVIYIDTDDDVTSIISRIKASKESVVALVSPKRIGVLQSVVNLKLIERATKGVHKKLSLVTTDPALVNLASGLEIPVAKNINAQAIIPETIGDDEVSDIIDGDNVSSQLTARDSHNSDDDKDISAAVAAIETDDKIKNDLDADGVPDNEQKKTNTKKAKKPKSVPDFASFRKKLLVIGGLAIVLIAFFVWALVFAPAATITIKAKTISKDISATLTLAPSAETNVEGDVLAPIVKQKKSNESIDFEATGSKETGEKAKGTITVCNYNSKFDPDSGESNTVTIPAGTRLYADGKQYVTDAAVSVEGKTSSETACKSGVSVKATAVNYGPEYNIGEDTLLSVAGYSSDEVGAVVRDAFTGGTKQTVKVVQQADIDNAVAKLKEQIDTSSVKQELSDQMSSNTKVVDDSFTVSYGAAKSTPAVDETPSGKASVSVEVSYTLVGIANDDLSKLLDNKLKAEDDSTNQKIYDNVLKSVKFSGFKATNSGYQVSIKAVGHIGPSLNEDDIKKNAVGKKSEEIKSFLSKTTGVNDVDVTMSPFWVSKAPSADKIKINFTIDE